MTAAGAEAPKLNGSAAGVGAPKTLFVFDGAAAGVLSKSKPTPVVVVLPKSKAMLTIDVDTVVILVTIFPLSWLSSCTWTFCFKRQPSLRSHTPRVFVTLIWLSFLLVLSIDTFQKYRYFLKERGMLKLKLAREEHGIS